MLIFILNWFNHFFWPMRLFLEYCFINSFSYFTGNLFRINSNIHIEAICFSFGIEWYVPCSNSRSYCYYSTFSIIEKKKITRCDEFSKTEGESLITSSLWSINKNREWNRIGFHSLFFVERRRGKGTGTTSTLIFDV